MTSKQAATLRRLKAIENKTWSAMVAAAPCAFDSATAIPYLGEDHLLVVGWREAGAAVKDFMATLPIYGW